MNNDRRPDILACEHWYEAPSWTRHRIREIPLASGYIDNFSDLPIDVDRDGWTDVVQIGYFARRVVWLRKPGERGQAWDETEIDGIGPTEFAFLVDLTNDGHARELLPQFTSAANPLVWYEIQDGRWVKHIVSGRSYGHGIGAGDVNGDGRSDIVTPQGRMVRGAGGSTDRHVDVSSDRLEPDTYVARCGNGRDRTSRRRRAPGRQSSASCTCWTSITTAGRTS